MSPGDEARQDSSQLNRPLIQQAAGLILALRWVADGLAAFLLLFCYPAGSAPAAALLIKVVFVGHAFFSALAYRRYRRGAFSATFVHGDVVATTCTMLVGAHFAEGIYSPILYLLLVEIASFLVIFGARPGRMAALIAAAGILVQATADALGFWIVPGMAHAPGSGIPRVLDFATMLAASALFLIGITRTLRWAGAKEQGLRVETARAQAAAQFQTALSELALATLTQEGLEATLVLLCERARILLGSDVVLICLRDGTRLSMRAVAPSLGRAGWTVGEHDPSPVAVAVRECRVVLSDGDGAAKGLGPALAARGIRRVLALPLIGRSGRVLGSLTCADHGAPRDLATWQVRGELIAALGAAAVERAHLVESLQEEAERVRALLRVSEEVGHWGSYRELVVNVCRLTRELLGADRATLLRWDDVAGQFAGSAHDGMAAMEVEELSRLQLAMAKEPERVPAVGCDGTQDERLIVAPLVHAGRVYGGLAAHRTGMPAPFDAREVALLEGIARQVGMALDNLRLLEDERNAAALATTLLEVAREFNQALELSSLLARLAARAVELTGAAGALIALWRPRDRVYRIDAVHGPSGTTVSEDVELGSDAYRPGAEGVHLDADWRTRFAASLGVDGDVTDVSVVMERGGEIAGVLTLLWGAGKEPAPRQLALARGLAHQAVVTLQNVHLLEDLREASRLKSEFVATMSHELRTPLNVIMGYTNLFLEEAFGPLTERQRGVLGRMQHSASELFDLVTATLDLNRLEAGKSRVRVEPVLVPELFSQLEAETTTRLDHGHLEVRWEMPPDLPAMETDRAKLRIVLKNLVGNAVKFTEKGTVTVCAEAVEDGSILFTVTDTGIGIRKEDLPVIFDMFRQVEAASTRKHGGVGLGLYIVKRLLTELRGEIEVESEYGVGTCFRIRVPVRLPAEPQQVAATG